MKYENFKDQDRLHLFKIIISILLDFIDIYMYRIRIFSRFF